MCARIYVYLRVILTSSLLSPHPSPLAAADCTAPCKSSTFSEKLQWFQRTTNHFSPKSHFSAGCTALGAFEVQVSYLDGDGVFHSECLHSKRREVRELLGRAVCCVLCAVCGVPSCYTGII